MSSERAIELHSMIIDGVDTWDDWNIVSVKKPVFNEPELKSTYIDIPGANGQLDLTEVLTGYPTFNNRTGTIQFFLYDDSMKALEKLNIIRNYLHGRKHKIVLNDEPDYYYEGRLVMRDSHPTKEGEYAAFNLEYNLAPYKLELVERRIEQTLTFTPSSGLFTAQKIKLYGSPKPATPKFEYTLTLTDTPTTAPYLTVKYGINTYQVSTSASGTVIFPQIVMLDGEYELEIGLTDSDTAGDVTVALVITYQGGYL